MKNEINEKTTGNNIIYNAYKNKTTQYITRKNSGEQTILQLDITTRVFHIFKVKMQFHKSSYHTLINRLF